MDRVNDGWKFRQHRAQPRIANGWPSPAHLAEYVRLFIEPNYLSQTGGHLRRVKNDYVLGPPIAPPLKKPIPLGGCKHMHSRIDLRTFGRIDYRIDQGDQITG
jgi:hypothetical protein